MHASLRALLLCPLIVACDVLLPASEPEPPKPLRLPAQFTCENGPGPHLAPAPKAISNGESNGPMAGQMTQQAAQAKRLFDGEKWSDAVMALQLVATGATGDDVGNQQLAFYHMAIALYRLHREEEAADAFRSIASTPNHLKHNETLLWLSKFVTSRPELVHLEDFSFYDESTVSKFNNPNQREIYFTLAYMLGRERAAEGDLPLARRLFDAAAAPDSPARDVARVCLRVLSR